MSENDFVDDLQEMVDAKANDCCQILECCEEAIYSVTLKYGVRDEDCETSIVCHTHYESKKKEAKDWAYGFLFSVLPGKRAVEVKKKRGRPKNL
jgi:hypothetical protein